MNHHRISALCILLGGVLGGGPAHAADWDFRNLYFSIGVTEVSHDIRFPGSVRSAFLSENPPKTALANYTHDALKSSLLIDVRFDLRFHDHYSLVPGFSFWNWGDFPEEEDQTETSIRGFGLNVDLQRRFRETGGIQPYLMAGTGLQVLNTLVRFGSTFFAGARTDIARMEQSKLALGGNGALGLEFPIRQGRNTVFTEIRYETAPGIRQVKFLVGISTF